MVKAVIFDLWGTLFSALLPDNAEKIAKELNLKGKKGFWRKWGIVSVKSIETMDEVIMGFCQAAKREDKFNYIQALMKDIQSRTEVFEDVIPTILFLKKKKLKLGLITNTDKPSFLFAAPKLDFGKFFDIITTSFETGLLKPQPKIFLLTVNGLGLEPRECMMVGDSLREDVLGPKELGMMTVLIDRKNRYKRRPPRADYLIKNLSELREII